MKQAVIRPDHLPDFAEPPLNEVVVGVQFSAPQGYQQIQAGRVWDLFKSEYPLVQEHVPLPPSFETFGLSPQVGVPPQIMFSSGATHDRFWFLRPGGEELIQFQQDRLLHNWRKVEGAASPYPRFEVMLERFQSELMLLERFVSELKPQVLNVTQCEVSYINHIPLSSNGDACISDWVNFVTFADGKQPEDLSVAFRDTVRADSGTPIARFTCEASTGHLPSGGRILVLNLTVKGAPKLGTIDSALDFLRVGREVIVSRFAGLTTERAHKLWGRVK